MKALRSVENSGTEKGQVVTRLENLELRPIKDGEVLIRTEFSSLNYKDALGVTGSGAIFKTLPITGGIDAAGTIVESRHKQFKAGDRALVTGCGLGETHDGGYAEFVIEAGENVVAVPEKLSARDAMIYGTAGFTAALVLARLEQNGQTPAKGPMLVTGASGGVGQFAVSMLAKKNYEVWALTGKKEIHGRLKELGAAKILAPEELKLATRPLEKSVFGGVVDNVGGKILAGVIPQINLWGNVACVGLADSADLHTTVMPIILRGVSILGISSNNTPFDLRQDIWRRQLAGELKPKSLESFVTREIKLDEVVTVAHAMLARKTSGRILVIPK